jgi:hypothetical protein
MSARIPPTKSALEPTRLSGLSGRYDRVRGALRNALEGLVQGSETIEVSPTGHNVTTWQLFDLAREVRARAGVSIAWLDNGALTYVLLPSKAELQRHLTTGSD